MWRKFGTSTAPLSVVGPPARRRKKPPKGNGSKNSPTLINSEQSPPPSVGPMRESQRKEAETMKKTMKHGVLALALLGSAALCATSPAVANSIHDEGDFGGGYRIIGPSADLSDTTMSVTTPSGLTIMDQPTRMATA